MCLSRLNRIIATANVELEVASKGTEADEAIIATPAILYNYAQKSNPGITRVGQPEVKRRITLRTLS